MALPRLLCLWLLVVGTRGVSDGDVRLASGDAPSEGRVEIFYGGQWGTVCDNLWDLEDASVVCRALGFGNATEALGGAAFGPGTGPVMLDEVQCTGTEPSLANCSSLGWLRSKCRHSQDAGVVCSNETGGAHTLDLSGALPAALAQIFDRQRGCDLTVAVTAEGAEPLSLCAHSLVLASNPEAQALWAEPGSSVTMEVDAECLPVVMDFIRYFYSRRIAVSLPTVKCFHQLASAFGARQLQAYCAGLFAFLLPQDLSFRTALDLHAYALATRDPALQELCARFLAWNFEALTAAEAWPRVPTALLRALLSRSELAVPSELALLTALDAWSRERGAAPGDVEGLVREVRFPMIPPAALFQLRGSLSLYPRHRALFQERTLQALEFHTVPLPQLAQLLGRNLSQEAYRPRLYTSATWSWAVDKSAPTPAPAPVTVPARRHQYGPYLNRYSYDPYPYRRRRYFPSPAPAPTPSPAPTGSFQTPPHPSFLFRDSRVSWTLAYLPTVRSCWDHGLSCSADEVPVLGLSSSGSSDPTIGYENRALMLCGGRFVADVTGFAGGKAPIPDALGTHSSRPAASFPCPAGSFGSFRGVVRPFYLTNSTGED